MFVFARHKFGNTDNFRAWLSEKNLHRTGRVWDWFEEKWYIMSENLSDTWQAIKNKFSKKQGSTRVLQKMGYDNVGSVSA